jgi:hypothetical protein
MGIHPNASSFDRRSDDLREARLGLWVWAEAIIVDRLLETYARVLDEAGAVAMARKHHRLWRALLFDGPAVVQAAADEIDRAASGLGLPGEVADGVDAAIVEELVDVVTGRFGSSRNALRTSSLVLMSVTSRLGAARSVR